MDAVFHMVVPCVVMLPVHVAIEKHFAHEEFLLQTLPPREKNKLRYKRQRDQHYITETGWTWTIFYAGITNEPWSEIPAPPTHSPHRWQRRNVLPSTQGGRTSSQICPSISTCGISKWTSSTRCISSLTMRPTAHYLRCSCSSECLLSSYHIYDGLAWQVLPKKGLLCQQKVVPETCFTQQSENASNKAEHRRQNSIRHHPTSKISDTWRMFCGSLSTTWRVPTARKLFRRRRTVNTWCRPWVRRRTTVCAPGRLAATRRPQKPRPSPRLTSDQGGPQCEHLGQTRPHTYT